MFRWEIITRSALAIFVVSSTVGFRVYRPTTIAALRDRIASMLPSTVSHWALAGLGFVLASESAGEFSADSVLSFVTIMSVIFFLLAGTWLINDIFDKETDEHTNSNRTTVRGTVSDATLVAIGSGCIAIGGLLAITVGRFAVAAVCGIVFVNVIYSVPPLRLKSHALTNMLCNGTLGGLGFLLGTTAALDRPTPFIGILFVAVVTAVSINIPYWDLKDAEHDAKSGSDTIVVRFGTEKVRWGLIVALPATYVMFATLLELVTWLPVFVLIATLAVGVLHYRQDDYHRLAHELDVVNGLNHATLAALYVLT